MAKVKKSAVKIIKKKWVPILASSEFNNQPIGETFVAEDQKAAQEYYS